MIDHNKYLEKKQYESNKNPSIRNFIIKYEIKEN